MGQLDFTPVEQSNQGEPQIVVFETQAAQPQARVPTHQLRLGGLSDTEKVDSVSALHCVRLAAGRQLLFRVGGNRVVHAQPRHAIRSGLPPDQVRVGQPRQCFDDGSDILASAHASAASSVPPAAKAASRRNTARSGSPSNR